MRDSGFADITFLALRITRYYANGEQYKEPACALWCCKIATTMSGNYGSPPYVPESVPSTAAELCFNFKRRRVPGPPASIPVTKCLGTRKYVPRCRNRFFFSLNVLHYCQHALFFSPVAFSLPRA